LGWLIRKRKRNVKRKNVQTGKGVNVFVMANRLGTVIESRYKIGEIKPSLFVKKLLYIFLVLMSFTTGNSYSLEKVPVPDSVDKKTKSPWNFSEDFENQEEGKLKVANPNPSSSNSPSGGGTEKSFNQIFRIYDKGAGLKPFRIKKDLDGNKYLEVTVKHGWNNDPLKEGSGKETERAIFETKQRSTLNKEIWIGFKTRLPKDFKHTDGRVTFFEFKNRHVYMRTHPLVRISFDDTGKTLKIAGNTAGTGFNRRNKEDNIKHRIDIKYKKNDSNWFVRNEKTRGEKKIRNNFKLTPNKTFSVTQLGEWSTYKIGIYNTKDDDGFVKVFKDKKLIFDYKGITSDWKGKYTGTNVRIGVYRHSGKQIGIEYPDQSIHFDDFIVVSDQKTLDQLIRKNENPND
jgi:hypothetical protein